jgi:Na+/proline symporter
VSDPGPPPVRRAPDPLVLLVVGVAAGVVVAALRRPQPGMFVVAASLAVGGVLRLVLRPRDAGSLVVRTRRIDVIVLFGLAVGVAVLAAVTPFPGGHG